MAQQILSTNTFTTAKWIVSATSSDGTHTTIAAALTSASSGDTIFIRPGTYTENLTLKAGVNLTAFESDSSLNATGKVIISGTCTLTTAGSVTISGIQLQTNSAALLAVTGTLASVVNLNNCYLNCTNNTGITYSSSSPSSAINIYKCSGNLGTTGIAAYSMSSAGNLNFVYSIFSNSGSSTTASSNSSGLVQYIYSNVSLVISTSSTGSVAGHYGFFQEVTNDICITTAGTGSSVFYFCEFVSGSASAISIGSGTTVSTFNCVIVSSATNAITGAGTSGFGNMAFTNSILNNSTTQTGGSIPGIRGGNAPSAGYIGEQIRAALAVGSATSLTSNTAKNVTSISLTAGIWDVSGIVGYLSAAGTSFTAQAGGISTVTNTFPPNINDDSAAATFAPAIVGFQMPYSIPSYRITLASTTTVYLVALATFTVSTCTVFGRISATRVG